MRIRKLSEGQLDLLEPLWNALREHHAAVAPGLGVPRSREESWARRRAQYEGWLSEPDSFALVAERAHMPVGYAMVHLRAGSPTWPLSERAGEVETLSVLPEMRGEGIGTTLLEAVREELAKLGVAELSLHVLSQNEEVMRFYERNGFEPFAIWFRTA